MTSEARRTRRAAGEAPAHLQGPGRGAPRMHAADVPQPVQGQGEWVWAWKQVTQRADGPPMTFGR